MVKTRAEVNSDAEGRVDLEAWVASLPPHVCAEARGDVLRAARAVAALPEAARYARADECLPAGIDIVQILADLHLGRDSLVAGMLCSAREQQLLDLDGVEAGFGASVRRLLEGVERMSAISALRVERDAPVLGQADGQKDNIRKMLVAMVDDVRVALIKLAERTRTIRAVKNDEERRLPVAREVFDVYAPLAHRLGIGQIKWELEDLSFRYLYPEAYRKIAALLDGKRLERDLFIDRVKTQLTETLGRTGLDALLQGRSKHIYSIWRKMHRKGIGFSQVYDIRAVRVLVPEVKDCYAALGVLHGLWRNIANEFDDYIANPKENGYRSLHTAVIGPEGKVLEVQIRTREMDEEAELGVCAHWRYKGADGDAAMASSYEEKISWLRQVLEWHEETGAVDDALEQFSTDIAQDRVYVFTPGGDVVNLAEGATPLDCAYHIHTEVGHCCRGARVNGTLVPLTYRLQTGQQVEILTSKEGEPRRDWLAPGLGYLRTSRARSQVQNWFKSRSRQENIDSGRHLLEREFSRLALTSVDYKRLALKLQQGTVEDMYTAVGAGDLSAAQVLQAAQSLFPMVADKIVRPRLVKRGTQLAEPDTMGKVGELESHLARCCNPALGDAVLGYVTQGRGVSIHRRDCPRLLQLQYSNPEQMVEVPCEEPATQGLVVEVEIEAYERPGLLRDITELLLEVNVNLRSVNTNSASAGQTATMRLCIEVADLAVLGKLLDRMIRLSNVISARRIADSGELP